MRLVDRHLLAAAIIRITATYVCGSHLWPYRGINRVAEPTFLHCLTGGARRLDHIWRGFASSIRTWQYRSANSTRLRRTSRPRKAICGRRCQQEAPTPAPFVGATRPPPVSALEMSFALAAALAIGREQSRDLPDDAKKA